MAAQARLPEGVMGPGAAMRDRCKALILKRF